VRDRAALCDRLALLRHPLMVPLVDYGMSGRDWFEAHAVVDPLRLHPQAARGAVLHVVRFVRAAGLELTARDAERNIRVCIDGSDTGRPVGVFLRDRAALDVLRTVVEAAGPAGTTAIDVVGGEGAGLRTARWQMARIARLAGYLVVDARAHDTAGLDVRMRHVCAIDWMPRARILPRVLARASVTGGRRHMWIRFHRPAPGAGGGPRTVTVHLEPMTMNELTAAIYLDPELGPTASEVRAAVERAHGWPGRAVAVLAGMRSGHGAGWVHETPSVYGEDAGAAGLEPRDEAPSDAAGVTRLRRAAAAAADLAARGGHVRAARVMGRCAQALARRGAREAAALVACQRGDILLLRADPVRAGEAFTHARDWATAPSTTLRALVGSGRALLEQRRLVEAEAVFRTTLAADDERAPCGARTWLARTLWHRGEREAALAFADAESWLAARVLLDMSRVDAAARAASAALARGGAEAEELAQAHAAAAQVHAVLGDLAAVRRHGEAAAAAARRAGNRALRLIVAAERVACLERCGVASARAARSRLLRAAARLPPLAAARIRDALASPRIVPPPPPSTLVQHFQSLVDAVHETPDELAALQVMAAGALRALSACSAAIRSAHDGRIVAAAGRSWAGEEPLARGVLDGGAAVERTGATPEAAEPIVSGGAIVGSIALRWVTGAHPGWERVREVVRATAIAAAPLLRAIEPVVGSPADEAGVPDDLLGPSETAARLREAIRRAAAAPYPVLVEGESGSGKELVARAIHARSVRRARRFCAINCAALSDELIEAELFGHARGAFTGAHAERLGLFEEADQGTLFLDEVGELSLRAQAKLLRVLQEGEVRRVGENVARRVDVRVVAATNRLLEQEAQAGRFRADLRFRLDVIRIQIPPLRDRLDDLPWLVDRVWRDVTARVGSKAALGPDMRAALARYDWPGNVRELQNVLASIAVHGPRRGRVPESLLPARIAHEAARGGFGFEAARLDFERRFVRAALARAAGSRSLAADQLGISRQGLAKMIKRLGLD
jgi:DNA-binding NtrC family response regulator